MVIINFKINLKRKLQRCAMTATGLRYVRNVSRTRRLKTVALTFYRFSSLLNKVPETMYADLSIGFDPEVVRRPSRYDNVMQTST